MKRNELTVEKKMRHSFDSSIVAEIVKGEHRRVETLEFSQESVSVRRTISISIENSTLISTNRHSIKKLEVNMRLSNSFSFNHLDNQLGENVIRLYRL